MIYSLIETAKETGLDLSRYLAWFLKIAPTLDSTVEGWVSTRSQRMLRWTAELYNLNERQR